MPRSEMRERALTAVQGVRRRRTRMTAAWVVGALVGVPLLLGAAVATGVLPLPWPVKGNLYWRSAAQMGPGWSVPSTFRSLSGRAVLEEDMPSSDADPSPVDEEIVWADGLRPELHPTHRSVLIRHQDGSDTNLTELAGIGGLNCKPKWSPDGTMIAWQHVDAVGDKPPCKDGFAMWVMEADGSGAHQVLPEGSEPTSGVTWFPDGRRLLFSYQDKEGEFSTDLSGSQIRPVPGLGGDAIWSPDGTKIASTTRGKGVKDGQPGVWRRLVLADSNGYSIRVLAEQFLADKEIAARYPTEEQLENDPQMDWIADLKFWVGPTTPQWSPEGDKIAFLAALPFDPNGPYYRMQVEVWIYDLKKNKLVRVTDDTEAAYALVWQHPEK